MKSHIAVFLPSLQAGGAERVTVMLANGFAERGHRVDLVVASKEGPFLAEVSDRVRIVDLGRKRILAVIVPLAVYLRRERPSALLSAMTHVNIVAILAKFLSGGIIPTLVTEHSAPSRNLKGGGANRVLRALIHCLYRKADGIISVSQGVRQEFATLFALPREKLSVIYNPMDIGKIRNLMEEPLNHPWMNDDGVPVILAAGRLTEAKDYPTLLRAFALLRARRPHDPVRLVILGQGEEETALKALAAQLDLNADIFFAGFQANPYAWMHRCDLYVMSSAWEGLPGALMEALACGAKVVSTNCPTGPDEILEDGKWGTLVPVGDADKLAEAMQASLTSGPSSAPEESLSRFEAGKVIDRYLDLLTSKARTTPGSWNAA